MNRYRGAAPRRLSSLHPLGGPPNLKCATTRQTLGSTDFPRIHTAMAGVKSRITFHVGRATGRVIAESNRSSQDAFRTHPEPQSQDVIWQGSPTSLKWGSWGARIATDKPEAVALGDVVAVTNRDGASWLAVVDTVVWRGPEVVFTTKANRMQLGLEEPRRADPADSLRWSGDRED